MSRSKRRRAFNFEYQRGQLPAAVPLKAGEAPLKETLSAGIIRLRGDDGTQQFADFMCGRGTLSSKPR
jgi:hypothetical protein